MKLIAQSVLLVIRFQFGVSELMRYSNGKGEKRKETEARNRRATMASVILGLEI